MPPICAPPNDKRGHIVNPLSNVSIGMTAEKKVTVTPEMTVGHTVRTVSRVIEVDAKSVLFDVEAWDGDRKIGDGTHRRGVINVAAFEKRLGAG